MDAKLKALWASIKAQIIDIWNRSKIFIISFFSLLLIAKFRNIMLDWLISNSKKIDTNAHKEDTKAAETESKDSQKADALVAQAKALPATETPVTEDWYKNQ